MLLPRTIGRHHILSGQVRGYTIVTSWYDYPAAILGYTESSLLDWFAKNVQQRETWLDIGAHYGYTAIALCELVGVGGRIFAFEPMVSTASYLTQTRMHNDFKQLTIIPVALGASNTLELARLHIVRGMVDSTLQGNGWMETILVFSLDWLWPQICGEKPRIDGIKIDVQGMEIETLRGMRTILRTYKPKLVVEIHTGVDRGELLELLEEAGYSSQAIPVEPIEGESEPLYVDNRSYVFNPQP